MVAEVPSQECLSMSSRCRGHKSTHPYWLPATYVEHASQVSPPTLRAFGPLEHVQKLSKHVRNQWTAGTEAAPLLQIELVLLSSAESLRSPKPLVRACTWPRCPDVMDRDARTSRLRSNIPPTRIFCAADSPY